MAYMLKIFRDSTEIMNINGIKNPIADDQTIQSFTISDTPTAGTYTYYAKICETTSNPHYAALRSISLLETKK